MSNSYKCYHCEKVSNVEQWNNSTQSHFTGLGIEKLNNDTDLYSTSFICPKCSEMNDGWVMKKEITL